MRSLLFVALLGLLQAGEGFLLCLSGVYRHTKPGTVLKLSVLSEMIVTEQNATRRAELLNALEESYNLKLRVEVAELKAEVAELKAELAEQKRKAELAELKMKMSQLREMIARTEMLDAEGALNMRAYLEKCEQSIRESTGIKGNRTVLWTNLVLLQRTRGQAFVECLERQGIFKDLQVPPEGVTVHEAKARFIGGYMQALVDRLNMNQRPQFLSSELEIIEGETVSAQDCKVIKCLADHLYPVVARIIPRIQFGVRLNAEDQ